jgi:hypothetical protein
MFKDILCDDKVERLIRERKSFQILAPPPIFQLTSRYLGKELTGDIMFTLLLNLVRRWPSRRRSMYLQFPPSGEMIIENFDQRTVARD